MATVPAKRSRVKPALHVHLTPTLGTIPGVLYLGLGKAEETGYFLYPVPSDFGKGFRLEKFQGGEEPYHVNLAGEQSTCECLGSLRWGHCKHVAALIAPPPVRPAVVAPSLSLSPTHPEDRKDPFDGIDVNMSAHDHARETYEELHGRPSWRPWCGERVADGEEFCPSADEVCRNEFQLSVERDRAELDEQGGPWA